MGIPPCTFPHKYKEKDLPWLPVYFPEGHKHPNSEGCVGCGDKFSANFAKYLPPSMGGVFHTISDKTG